MRKFRLAVTGGLCAAGVLGAGLTPALAAPSGPAVSPSAVSAPQDCHIRFYFNQNTYVRTRPAPDATHLGLAYANDTFVDMNQSSNGYRYGRDGRSGGKTGWVPAANISQQKVCS